MPIASISKLMTAMVVIDSEQALDPRIAIKKQDVDRLRYSSSRLPVGTQWSRHELLRIMLVSSDNRAAFALARTHQWGKAVFVYEMNQKAFRLGMVNTQFIEPSGLSHRNLSTVRDLAKMVWLAHQYDLIRQLTTLKTSQIPFNRSDNKTIQFRNTNLLLFRKGWRIGLSKTSFIHEAGYCLVLQVNIADRDLIVVLLKSTQSKRAF